MTPIAQAAAIAALTPGGRATAMSGMPPDVPDIAVRTAIWVPGDVPDAHSFQINAVLPPRDPTIIEAPRFVGCKANCDFDGPSDQTWIEGAVTHIAAVTRRPPAPHTGGWHGQCPVDAIALEPCAHLRAWYRTHRIMGTAKGNALPTAAG